MKLTIAFITARQEPHLPWLLDALEAQMRSDDQISILVVDALGRETYELDPIPPGIARPFESFEVVLPKPNIWQGKHKIAPRDFFANANARNTAICYCETDYIAFLDDRCKPCPTWLETVRKGEIERQSVICGPYDKLEDRPTGLFVSQDHRKTAKPGGMRGCSGSWCFGGNFALPLEWLLEVNGHEEGCDPTGQEDCVLGLMLANLGRRIDFVPAMAADQDRRGPVHPLDFPRLDKGPSPHDRSHALIDRFAKLRRTEFTPDLRVLRERVLAGQPDPFPIPDPSHDYRDWWDRQLVRETTCNP